MVALARSAPVGRPALVLRTERVRLEAPVQALQKSWTSTLASNPVTAGIKLWPVQLGVPKPVPVVVPAVFCWSTVGAFKSVKSPGLVFRSTLVETPVRKSLCVVSVKQALAAAVASEKSCVVVPPSVTTIDEADAGKDPGKIAVIDG